MNTKKTKKPGVLNIGEASDLHLAEIHIPTDLMTRNLDQYMTNESVLKDLDILIIAGDVFHRLLQNSDPLLDIIHSWITRLLFKCGTYDVLLLIVEGTPSHDWRQSRFFIEQAINAKIPVQVHYATTLSIQYIPRFDINVLYVPDKLPQGPAQTFLDVKAMMRERELDHVDYAIMHGAFEHQLPSIVKEPTHCAADYLSIVKYLIFIGHVHTPSCFERILAAGSFDRTGHGEEHPKGWYHAQVFDNGDFKVRHVENKGAMRFDTVSCHGLDARAAMALLVRKAKSLPKGSAIRVTADRHDLVWGDFKLIARMHPEHMWTDEIDKTKKQKSDTLNELFELDLSAFEPIVRETISAQIQNELVRQGVDPQQRARLEERIPEIL